MTNSEREAVTKAIHASTHGVECDFETCIEDAYTFENEAIVAIAATNEKQNTTTTQKQVRDS